MKTAVPSRQQLPSNSTYNENFGGGGKPCLVNLDDLLNDVYSKQVCELFTKGNLHRNISLILVTLNLFNQGGYCRDISLNAQYLVTLQNVRGKKQFMYLAHQVYPKDRIGS